MMHNQKWLGLIACGMVATLTACDDPRAPAPLACPDGMVCECAGDLDMTIELAHVPDKMRATFHGEMVIDDCFGQAFTIVSNDRTPHALILNNGGFGFTPPNTISLEVFDQGDCSATEVLIFAVTDEPVPGAPFTETCMSATIFFPASEGCYSDDACDDGLTCSAQTECLPPPNCGDDPCPEVCYGYCVAP
ncbi:MAG: hypothetical protein IPL79_01145 [Myxococcales bacterium]|nr:hypothetical protein [Myxococcales bacterium]